MSIGIYKYQNKINGHIYIGQSTNIERTSSLDRIVLNLYRLSPLSGSTSTIGTQMEKVDNKN